MSQAYWALRTVTSICADRHGWRGWERGRAEVRAARLAPPLAFSHDSYAANPPSRWSRWKVGQFAAWGCGGLQSRPTVWPFASLRGLCYATGQLGQGWLNVTGTMPAAPQTVKILAAWRERFSDHRRLFAQISAEVDARPVSVQHSAKLRSIPTTAAQRRPSLGAVDSCAHRAAPISAGLAAP